MMMVVKILFSAYNFGRERMKVKLMDIDRKWKREREKESENSKTDVLRKDDVHIFSLSSFKDKKLIFISIIFLDNGQQYGQHSSNFGSRSLRENQQQQQQQNGKGVKSGNFGDEEEEEEADLDESEDYQLAKYLTEQYQTKKRRKKTNSGEGQRNCGADSIWFGGGGGRLWWLSFEVLTAALALRIIG